MALRCLAQSRGRAVEVDDAAIGRAQLALCREAGLFVEPSSAAAWAGFLADRANVDRRSTVVVLLTGTGFKDVKAAERLVALPEPCEARLGRGARAARAGVRALARSRGVAEGRSAAVSGRRARTRVPRLEEVGDLREQVVGQERLGEEPGLAPRHAEADRRLLAVPRHVQHLELRPGGDEPVREVHAR